MADQDTYPYELTYAISGVLNDDKTQNIIDEISNYLAGNGGDVEEVDEWGSQRLADGKRSGYYVRAYFEAPGELIPKVERRLQRNDDILRYVTLRMDAKKRRQRLEREDREAAEEAAETAAEEAAEEAEAEEAS